MKSRLNGSCYSFAQYQSGLSVADLIISFKQFGGDNCLRVSPMPHEERNGKDKTKQDDDDNNNNNNNYKSL